jgi:hypothetical protein
MQRSARRELGRAARAVGRRLQRMSGYAAGPAILMYHRVAKADYDPWRLAVEPERFAQQVAWLKRKRTILPLAEFAKLHRAGRLPRAPSPSPSTMTTPATPRWRPRSFRTCRRRRPSS